MGGTILKPVYKGVRYECHRCDSCKAEIDLEDEYSTYITKYKYCPYCGEEIIRYGKPIYEELPDWDCLREFNVIIEKAYRQLEYIIHCKKTETERRDLREKTELGEKYFGKSYYPLGNGNVCNIVNYIARERLHGATKNKLKKEFEE